MTIHIEDLRFQCIIGILDFERVTPQEVIINLTIDYEYVDTFINYADVVSTIKEEMKKSTFLLVEDALESLSKTLKEKFLLIDKLFLKITKPSILPDCTVSVSSSYIFQS